MTHTVETALERFSGHRTLGAVGLLVILLAAAACGSSRKAPGIAGPVRLVAWSPNGKQIAWYSGVRFWIANSDGSNAHSVAKAADSDCCSTLWWPRPKRLVYEDDFRVFQLSTDGRTSGPISVLGSYLWIDHRGTVGATTSPRNPWPLQLVNLSGATHRSQNVDHRGRRPELVSDTWPTFSPDGSRVAFARSFCRTPDGPCERGGIWEAPTPGGRARSLLRNGNCPSWSPDGQRLLFVDDNGRDLRVGDSRGRKSTVILRNPSGPGINGPCGFQDAGRPTWSADARHIAFISPVNWTLSIVSVSKRMLRVFPQLGGTWQFAWSPVSSELLVVSTAPSDPRLCNSVWLIDARDGGVRPLRRCPH